MITRVTSKDEDPTAEQIEIGLAHLASAIAAAMAESMARLRAAHHGAMAHMLAASIEACAKLAENVASGFFAFAEEDDRLMDAPEADGDEQRLRMLSDVAAEVKWLLVSTHISVVLIDHHVRMAAEAAGTKITISDDGVFGVFAAPPKRVRTAGPDPEAC